MAGDFHGVSVTGKSHFLTFLRLLDKDAQTKWRPQTTDRRYSPLSHSMKVSSHDQGLQILPKPRGPPLAEISYTSVEIPWEIAKNLKILLKLARNL